MCLHSSSSLADACCTHALPQHRIICLSTNVFVIAVSSTQYLLFVVGCGCPGVGCEHPSWIVCGALYVMSYDLAVFRTTFVDFDLFFLFQGL